MLAAIIFSLSDSILLMQNRTIELWKNRLQTETREIPKTDIFESFERI
jgi:hypothetical protein